ncbi:hypothetical protein L5515_015537 [Caenorhabditis briggsae]|uniref:Uncharacterized protein n=1 Tax=Caenorhabditis briggsae TaxID=6238 RepID=A0AAE9EFE1_CAEBR|nr:hypothetical protein L5515_015537 [Caenorhabditis briggsae]
MSTRRVSARLSAASKLIADASENDDGPPVLQMESPHSEADSEASSAKEKTPPVNLAEALMSQFSGGRSEGGGDKVASGDAADPFPKNFVAESHLGRLPRLAVVPRPPAPQNYSAHRGILRNGPAPTHRVIVAPPDAGIVGTNTSLGPARLLVDSRKRDSLIGNRAAVPPTIKRQTPLVTYNGGRPGQEIPRYIDLDDSPALSPRRSPPTSLDIQKMLREQPAVKMEVKMGGGGYVKYEKPEDVEEDFEDSDDGESEDVPKSDLAQKIKKTKERVSEEASNHSMLIGSMVINGLETLKKTNKDEFKKFSTELFGLLTKYDIQ